MNAVKEEIVTEINQTAAQVKARASVAPTESEGTSAMGVAITATMDGGVGAHVGRYRGRI